MKKKLKTKKAVQKRVKVTKYNLIRKKAYKSHLLRKKNSSRLRRLAEVTKISSTSKKIFLRMLPYL